VRLYLCLCGACGSTPSPWTPDVAVAAEGEIIEL
jgi:hypothetical protein